MLAVTSRPYVTVVGVVDVRPLEPRKYLWSEVETAVSVIVTPVTTVLDFQLTVFRSKLKVSGAIDKEPFALMSVVPR